MSVVAPSMCLVPVEVKKKVLDVLSYELSVMSGQSHSMGCRVELSLLQEQQVSLTTETSP